MSNLAMTLFDFADGQDRAGRSDAFVFQLDCTKTVLEKSCMSSKPSLFYTRYLKDSKGKMSR